ncbi:MAG TPA: fumarylacetoacetase [Phycisphaerales bacterium]|nr:fumarylacetoacetase [Phycisphaerales bacterium]
MMYEINDTHDPNLKSWVESANDPATDFPIQNLPWCAFLDAGASQSFSTPRLGVRIGDRVLDVSAAASRGLIARDDSDHLVLDAAQHMLSHADYRFDSIAYISRMQPGAAAQLRAAIQRVLAAGFENLSESKFPGSRLVLPAEEVEFLLPVQPSNYTDFYASIHHATRVGAMFRPDNPLLPNYKWVPIGYHGRASSIIASGTPVTRPSGQTRADDAEAPRFAPCRMLDYELEVGAVIARGNELGSPISIADAEDHILGLTLVNDWSARDLQKWEYQPLGPFLAKNFATTISPFIVTMEALAPFRCPAYPRPDADPRPLPYLSHAGDEHLAGIDITLEVHLASAEMRRRSMHPVRLSRGSFKSMYWTLAQLLTHHASNGCNLQTGDLLASGTVSGPAPDSAGCLLELTWDGPGKPRKPVELPTGEKRLFLEDADEIILRAHCERDGFRRIGFGECRGTIAPAKS